MKHIQEVLNNALDNPDDMAQRLYEELSKPNYKLRFKGGGSAESFIYEIPASELKYYRDEILACFPNYNPGKHKMFVMKVTNSGSLSFDDKPTYSQGDVVFHKNNTNFRYYLQVDPRADTCYICGYEREYYGVPSNIGRPFELHIPQQSATKIHQRI
jgi:hypothetical protein